MNRDPVKIRRQALLAASSVVLAMGGGCHTWLDDKAPQTASNPTPSASLDTPEALPSPSPTLATAPTPTATIAASATPTASSSEPVCVGLQGTPDWATCCDDRMTWCDSQHPGDFDAASECTFGPNFDGSTGCIPWGPPAPPRFRGAALA